MGRAEEDDQPEATTYHYDENVPPPQPVQFPPQQGQPQAYPPQQEQPQAYPSQQPGDNLNKPAPPIGTDGWSTDLFDCMDNPENAVMTAFFPCVTYGQIAEIVDNGQSSCATSGSIYGLIAIFFGCPCIVSCAVRTKLRTRYGLAESPAPDWVTHCFCEWCALCQEYRELSFRGLDPAIGWQGNVIKQQNIQMQQQATMAPPMNQAMM